MAGPGDSVLHPGCGALLGLQLLVSTGQPAPLSLGSRQVREGMARAPTELGLLKKTTEQ